MATIPLIGISGSVNKEETQHFLLRNYMCAILSGGAPVLLSPDLYGDILDSVLIRLGGVLLAGGNDVDPALYGERPIPQLGEVNPLRDKFETELIAKVVALRMPVLGICRGIQIMNTALGGTLWQDLPSQYSAPVCHAQTSPGQSASHQVQISPNAQLAHLTGETHLAVNSFHHQAVREVAPPLRVCALADDGVIEGIEHPALPFFIGVQWHPERMQTPASEKLFAAFCQAAAAFDAARLSLDATISLLPQH